MTTPIAWLRGRGLIHNVSHPEELERRLQTGPVTFYCGFDPTADSLHVGSMLPLLVMRKLQRFGHKPIAIVGTATGMIGDPSGKSEERKLLSREVIDRNVAGIRKQFECFLSFSGENACEILENGSWTDQLSLIDFLRDTGKHFSINSMLAKESIRSRLENREQGITYTEFSYMLLQAYDFLWLRSNRRCVLQVGGSDQWGNITAGIDLIHRKLRGADAFGLTFPLLTTAAGTKFGKTEQGTVWLDPVRTSPFRFYQYWLNTADLDIVRFLQLFSDLDDAEIAALTDDMKRSPETRPAQRRLAEVLTRLVHGDDATEKAIAASQLLFGASLAGADSHTLLEIFADVPSLLLDRTELPIAIADLLVRCGASASKSAGRRLIDGGGLVLNDERVTDPATSLQAGHFIDGTVCVLRTGKRNYFLVRLAERGSYSP